MQQTCQEQLAFKQMQRQAEKEEEEAFRKIMMAKFAEDDRIEQMNAQKRRMKQLEHKREVEKLIEDRRQQREADMVQTTLSVSGVALLLVPHCVRKPGFISVVFVIQLQPALITTF